jgi:hypothetical protein
LPPQGLSFSLVRPPSSARHSSPSVAFLPGADRQSPSSDCCRLQARASGGGQVPFFVRCWSPLLDLPVNNGSSAFFRVDVFDKIYVSHGEVLLVSFCLACIARLNFACTDLCFRSYFESQYLDYSYMVLIELEKNVLDQTGHKSTSLEKFLLALIHPPGRLIQSFRTYTSWQTTYQSACQHPLGPSSYSIPRG